MTSILTPRALNRATLARQGLLARQPWSVEQALEHLVGLQAQSPDPPYYGLWTRLRSFRPEDLSEMIEAGRALRIALMRSTIHLVTARDALALRAVVQPALEAQVKGGYGRHLAGIEREDLIAAGRDLFAASDLTWSELGRALAARYPGRDPQALANALRAWLPLAQVPPRGVWGKGGRAAHRPADAWLGRRFKAQPGPRALETLVLRYLRAFGPATVMDAQLWSRLTRLGEVFEKLRSRLITFRDDAGRELFDLPDAPRPHPDAPAPPRFLPEFDNLLLSHVDRTRVLPEQHKAQVMKGGVIVGSVLVDGFVAATWKLDRKPGAATLRIELLRTLPKAERAAVAAEARALLEFAGPRSAERTIAWSRPGARV